MVAALGLGAASCAPPPPAVDDPGTSTALTFLQARTGVDAAIVDGHGRQVQLRGANLNHLGDYHQAYAELPTVSPLTDEDWDDLAARGFDVVRLVTSWSAWEPERDQVDEAYLDRVRDAVEAANRRGIWVVIDMHQDAWSSGIVTPADEICPTGTTHQKGWDGAPAWATFTDGLPTCTPGSREESPAVVRAWTAFYEDRAGIRAELAELWGRIAAEFAGDPGVAGFDLLNEPGIAWSLDRTVDGLTRFYREALAAIRAAEDAAGAPHHLVFFGTTVTGPWVPPFSEDPNLVFAPHVYAESIGPSFPGLLDLAVGLNRFLGESYGRPVWIGEYGSFSSPGVNTAWMSRFARLHDASGYDGGTWWQWEQECGDPHSISYPEGPEWVASRLADCDGSRMDVACPARSYPRAVPGRLTAVDAAPCGGALAVTGTTPSPSTADLWFQPAEGSDPATPPLVGGTGVLDIELRPVDGGWRVFVRVDGDYRITLTPG